MAFTTGKAEYQNYQINTLDFRGDKIRYVISAKGVRQYFYEDICKVIGHTNSYVPKNLRESIDYTIIVAYDRPNHATTRSVINLRGITILAKTLQSQTLHALAKQITDDLDAENKSDETESDEKSTEDAQNKQRDESKTYADLIVYTFDKNRAFYTFEDENRDHHTISLDYFAALDMLGACALFICDYEDGKGKQLTARTKNIIFRTVLKEFSKIDRLPESMIIK